MLAIIPTRRTTALKARYTEAMTQTRKGLRRLGRGLQHFASRRPIVTVVLSGLGALAMLRAVGGRR